MGLSEVVKVETSTSDTVIRDSDIKQLSEFDKLTSFEKALRALNFTLEESLSHLVGIARNTESEDRDRIAAIKAIEEKRVHALRMSGRLANLTMKVHETIESTVAGDIRKLTKELQTSIMPTTEEE